MSEHDDYSVPKLGKIRLKETKEDRYERHYRREQRRIQKEQRKVYRANGIQPSPLSRSRSPVRLHGSSSPRIKSNSRYQPISPPRGRDESITPPRFGNKQQEFADELAQDEFAERLRFMEAEFLRSNEPAHTVGLAAGDDGRGGYLHIPRHVRSAAGISSSSATAAVAKGRPPDDLTEEAYAEYIRDGMYRRANAETLAREAAAAAKREAAERKAAMARAKAEEEEQKRMEELQKEARKRDRAMKKQREAEAAREERVDWRKEVQEYERRWEALRSGHKLAASATGVSLPKLGFADFPWPIYRPRSGGRVMLADLSPASIRAFLFSLVHVAPQGSKSDPIDIDAKEKDKKRVLREAILAFHPDRFLGRYLERAREDVKEDVKEAVGVCSRIINDLAAERK